MLTKLPPNRPPLQPAAFLPLPLGAVRPRGWLLDQLRVQADGLSGHLDEFWPDVGPNSGWLGGSGESWERGPYYCDGLIPLAYLLDDPALLAKAQRWIEWTLNSAQPNGQFGPLRNRDWWPRMIMLKVLAMVYEASGDARVITLMLNYCRYQAQVLKARPLESWGMARAMDNAMIVHWLYNITGESFLLDLSAELLRQTADWPSLQGRYTLRDLVPLREFDGMFTHVVNNAMGVKAAAVHFIQTEDESYHSLARQGIENLLRYHGQPNGIWSGDEHLNGTAPTSGTELCAVAEFMFSLEEMMRMLGDPFYGDQLERVAYNAFPATFKTDMWAHQYDQQVNQALATVARRAWTNNTDDSNIYGLEPHFGCCTANFHQGWPKLVKSLVMATPDGGLAVVAYGPCVATGAVAEGVSVTLTEETNYPFDGQVRIRLALARPARFLLLLRIPAWAHGAQLIVNHEESAAEPGTFARIERAWRDGDEVLLDLPMQARITRGHEGLVSIHRGPLLFGLKMGERWQKIAGEEPHADWEVYPTTPWNYGLALDLDHPENAFEIDTAPVSPLPFDPQAAPVTITAQGRRLPGWGLAQHSAGPISAGPQPSDEALETITLIPYGSTHLRVAAFPLIQAAET